jgi:hypothetical protein
MTSSSQFFHPLPIMMKIAMALIQCMIRTGSG